MKMNEGSLSDVLSIETINVSDIKITKKDELFDFMAELLKKSGRITSKESFISALYERERTGSTYMGNGIAVPHGKSSCVVSPTAAFCRCSPFVYGDDDEVVDMALMLAIPECTEQKEYIKILANISRLFLADDFLDVLRKEKSNERIFKEFNDRLTD